MKRFFYFLLLLSAGISAAQAQDDSNDLVQVYGMVVSGDSLSPVPFTSVMIKGSHRGTICDYYGFFSLVVSRNDTIEFSSVGYQGISYIIPDTLSDKRYSLIQKLQKDTVTLDEQIVYPWPSKEQFRDAFLSLNAPETDYDRAFENLTKDEIRLAVQGVPMSGQANYYYQVNREASRLYTTGQIPQISLLNPLAWAQFVRAWKSGDLKSKR